MNNLKNKYVIDFTVFIITILILNGCTSIPRYKDVSNFEKPPSVIYEVRDSDIVMMKAIGNQTSTNYIGVKPMSYDELSECAVLITSKTEKEGQLSARNKELNLAKQEIDKTNNTLEKERPKINLFSKKQVNDFNERNHRNIDVMKKMNANVDKYNTEIAQANNFTNKFNTFCANRPYRQSDMSLLSVSLKKIIENHSHQSDIPVIEK